MTRFEFKEGTSAKFWEIRVEGKSTTVRFGRIGTAGQVQTRSFGSPDEAKAAAEKLIREKTAKGYTEVARTRSTAAKASAAGGKTKAPPSNRGRGVDRKAIRARVQQTHGLTLPDSFFDFVDWWKSRPKAQESALRDLGISLYGVGDICEKGGLNLVASPGTEALLHARYFLDPPEFLTVLSGDSDGLHFGLWFDDPKQEPAFVASYYSRDDPSLHFAGADLFDVVRRLLADRDTDDENVRAVLESLPAPAAPKSPPPYDGARAWAGDLRLWVPRGPAQKYKYGNDSPEWLLPRIEAAMADAASKDPAKLEKALCLGAFAFRAATRENAELTKKSGELLERVYLLLGRDALARIAKIHSENRLLASVSVLVPKSEAAAEARSQKAMAKAAAVAPSGPAPKVTATLYRTSRRVDALALSPDGRTLALGFRRRGTSEPNLLLLDAALNPSEPELEKASPKTRTLVKARDGWIARVSFLRDGRILYWRVAPQQDENDWHGHLTVSTLDGKQLAETKRLPGSAAMKITASPDGTQVLFCDLDVLHLFDIPAPGKRWSAPQSLEGEAATFLGDGRIALHRSKMTNGKESDQEIVVCSADGKKEELRKPWKRYSFVGGGTMLFENNTTDRAAEVLDVSTQKVKKLQFFRSFSGGAITSDGRLGAAIGDRGDFAIFSPATGALLWKKKKLLGDAFLDEPVAIDDAGSKVAVLVARAEQTALLTLT